MSNRQVSRRIHATNAAKAIVRRQMFEMKVSAAGPLIAYNRPKQAVWTERDYAQMAKASYQKNVVSFRAIKTASRGAAKVPWCLYKGWGSKRKKVDDPMHPILKLLNRPNPWQAGADFWEGAHAFYKMSGNCYLEGVVGDGEPEPMGPGRPPDQLFCLRPDRMKVVSSEDATPMGYVYEVASRKKTWDADPFDGTGAIIHWKTFNPLNDFYGMAEVEAAAWSVDQHNEASEWNKSLLQNSGAPSGALTYEPKGNEGATLTPAQYKALKEEVEELYSGSQNSGRPMVLDGGLKWQQMGLSPKEMDWIEGKHVSAREICLAHGVPPYLLGIPGDSTYNNYREARQGMYEDTILPTLDSLCDMLNMALIPLYGEDLYLHYDENEIPALAPKRELKWKMVGDARFLSTNEKREATGHEPDPSPEADLILIDSTMVPLDTILDPPPGFGPDGAPLPDPNKAPKPGEPGDEVPPKPGKPKPGMNGKPPTNGAKKHLEERHLAERLVNLNLEH